MRRRFLSLCVLVGMACIAMAGGQAKYVFYFIGDGMGVNHVNGTETYLAATEGRIGTVPLCFAQFPYASVATSYSASNGITDSAAGGTALATGQKTRNGAVGVGADLATRLPTLAEAAKADGKAVGVATSVSVDHATPASFYAHVKDRGMYHQIGKDLVEAGFDFYAGSDFLKPENRELSGEKSLYEQCEEAGYAVARGYADYQQKAGGAEKIVLLQSEEASRKNRTCLPYAIDRQAGDLTLQDITRAAIDFLTRKGNEDGFFLMVEGGKIDWACHNNDAATVFNEVVDLDKAVGLACDFYKQHPDETLIVITADHETGGLVLGAGSTVLHYELLRHQRQSTEAFSREIAARHQAGDDGFTWEYVRERLQSAFGFWDEIPLDDQETGILKKAFDDFREGVAKDTRTLYATENAIAVAARQLLARKAMVGWQCGEHTNGYVPVFAVGAGAERFTGRIDNTEIPKRIAEAAGYEL